MRNVCVLMLISSLLGCVQVKTNYFTEPSVITIDDPNIVVAPEQVVPARIVLYIPERNCSSGPNRYGLIIDMRKSLKELFGRLFKETVIVESLDGKYFEKGFQSIVVPEIVSVFHENMLDKRIETLINVKYTFHGPNESIIWVATYRGQASGKTDEESIRRAVDLQFGEAMKGILESHWWDQ